jgi:general secretion pathway protein D
MKPNVARILIMLLIALPTGIIIGAQQPQQPILQQTPFGVREVPGPPAAPAATPPSPGVQPQPAPAPPQTPATTPPVAAQPVPAAASPQAQPADDVVPISLELDNTDIYQVIKIIADTLKLNYIIDSGIKGSVNVHTSGTLKRSDLFPLLETLLKINGATMVKVGNFYQIVPTTLAIKQPLPVLQANQSALDDQIVIQIIRMRFVGAAEMARLLTPYLSEGANIVAHETGNILLLSERRSNLRKLLDLIDVFDTKVFEGDRIRLLPVKNSFARDLVGDLKSVFAGYGLSEMAGAIRFVSMDRTNSILVIAGNQDIFPEVERWLERLDQPIATAGFRNYVYKVKNTKAADLEGVLRNLYAPVQRSGVPTAPQIPGQPPPASPQLPFSSAPPASSSGATEVLSGTATTNIRIIADAITNSLIAQATPQEWAEIERTIAQLDILPRQVLIDAQIYEVTLSDSLNVSLSAILQNRGTLTNPQTTASFVANGGPPALAGQTFAFVGRTRELIAYLNASENRSRVRTLSAPSVLVKDNFLADFTVGADIPVPTSSAVAAGVQSNGNSVFTQTIAFRSVGVIMHVRPQINDGGTLTLDVTQEVSDAQPNTTDTIAAPVIGRSAVASTIVVQDNQTVAISGFVRENKELDRSRLPLLGRIPGVGVLFGNTNNSTSRTELVVLITPHVIRTREDAESASEELKNKLREVQKLIK